MSSIEQFATNPPLLGSTFILGQSALGQGAGIAPNALADIAPSYLYQQYADDSDLTAFVSAYNAICQGYLDGINQTPLGLYTSENISGVLLDWLATGIYGITRPYVSTITNSLTGAIGTYAIGTKAIGTQIRKQSGQSTALSDDYYKRVLTWFLYRGDGYRMNTQWLRRRVARFLYGANGGDIPFSDIYNVSVSQTSYPAQTGAIGTYAVGTKAIGTSKVRQITVKHAITITVPPSTDAQIFNMLLLNGSLALPFQIKFTVT